MTAVQSLESPHAAGEVQRSVKWDRGALWFFATLAVSLLSINLVIETSRFLDYDTYLLYLDTIYHFPQPDWFLLEGVTKAYLLFLRAIAGTTRGAIEIAHYLLLFIFLGGFLTIFRRTPWEAAAVAAALFAPQLGLITIRATPAYLICTIATLRALEQRPWALRLALIGTMFHVSAFLALIPILATKILSRTPIARMDITPFRVAAFAVAAGAVTLLFAQTVFDILIDLFKQIPYLEKYSAYAVGLSDPNLVVEQTIREPTSANHYVFLVGVTLLFMAVVWFGRARSMIKLFAATGYLLYLAIFFGFSPVPAFRFAPFLALPILAATRLGPRWRLARSIAALPFLAACLAVFAVQVALVID